MYCLLCYKETNLNIFTCNNKTINICNDCFLKKQEKLKEYYLKQKELTKLNKNFKHLIDLTEKIKDNTKENILTKILKELTNISKTKDEEEIISHLCKIILACIEKDKNIHFTQNLYSQSKYITMFIKEISLYLRNENYQSMAHYCLCSILGLGYNPTKCLGEYIKELLSKSNDYQYGVYNELEYLKELENDIRFDYPCDNVKFEYKDKTLDIIIDYGLEVKTYALWYKANFDKCKL